MIELRNEGKKDNAFIEEVYYTTREAELSLTNWTQQQKTAFVMMQSMAQLSEYKATFPGAAFQIIIFNKKSAGRFYTWENENEIRLIDITILPKFRGRGIGTKLVRDLIKRADKVHKKISLHVDPANPALQLYQRLGFVYIKNNGRFNYLEKNPDLNNGSK